MSDGEASVMDLFRDIALAKSRMSVNNPNRLLLAKCEACIWHLSKELHRLNQPTVAVGSNPFDLFHVTPRHAGVITDIQEGVPV